MYNQQQKKFDLKLFYMAMTAHPFTIRLVCPSFYDPFTQVFHSWKYKFLANNILTLRKCGLRTIEIKYHYYQFEVEKNSTHIFQVLNLIIYSKCSFEGGSTRMHAYIHLTYLTC